MGQKSAITTLIPRIPHYGTYAEIGSIAEPAQIWSNAPSSHGINLRPDICQIAHRASKERDVGGGFDWALQSEE